MSDITSLYSTRGLSGVIYADSRILAQGSDAIDTANSTITQAGPVPGDPIPQSDTELELRTSGTQVASDALRIETIRAGFPGQAGFAYEKSGDALARGWDIPTYAAQWEAARVVSSSDTTKPISGLDTVTLSNGKIVTVYGELNSALSAHQVRCTILDPADASWSTVTIRGLGYTYSTAREPHPALLTLDSGRILCFYWVEIQSGSSAGDLQLDVSYSDDSGATWAIGARSSLPAPVTYEASTGTPTADHFMRIGPINVEIDDKDGIVLFAELWMSDNAVGAGNTRNIIRQYGSRDLGSSFLQVAESAGTSSVEQAGTKPRVVKWKGSLLVYWVRTLSDLVNYTRIGSAFEPFTSTAVVVVQESAGSQVLAGTHSGAGMTSGQETTADDYGVCVSDSGTVYVAIRDFAGGAAYECTIIQSKDGGATYEALGQSAVDAEHSYWHAGSTNQAYPAEISITWQRSRVVVLSHHFDVNGAGTYEDSIDATFLGGPTTVTARSYDGTGRDVMQTGTEVSYVPYASPADSAWTITGTAGAGSLNGSAWHIDTTNQLHSISRTPTGTVAEGFAVEFDLDVISGGDATSKVVFARLQNGDGATEDFIVEIWVGTTTVRIVDVNNASAEIATPTIEATSAGLMLRVEMVNNDVRWWTLARTTDPDRKFVAQTGSAALTDGGGAAASSIVWGHATLSTAVSNWRRVTINSDEWVGDLTSAQTNPDELHPRDFSIFPVHVDGGLFVRGVAGPTLVGDIWHVDTRYNYGADRMLPWVEPSPRNGWRSTNTTQVEFAFNLQPDSEGGSIAETLLIGIAVIGANWRTGKLYGDTDDGPTWTQIGSNIDAATGLTGLSYTRKGNSIYGSADGSLYFRRNELAGWTADLGSSKLRRVRGNDSGEWNTTGKIARLILEGCDGTEPASGTVVVYPPDFVLLFRVDVTAYWRFKLQIDTQTTVDGDLRVGSLIPPGPVVIFGREPTDAPNVSITPNVQVRTARDLTRRSRKYAPVTREATMRWGFVDETRIMGATPSPDHLTSTTTGGAHAVATPSDTHRDLQGLIEATDGPLVPICFVDNFALGPPDTTVINRPDRIIYGEIPSGIELQPVWGSAGIDVAYSVPTFTVREIP